MSIPVRLLPVFRGQLATRLGIAGVVSGSALFFLSAMIVNLGNYLFNLLFGRWLGPAAFADLSLVVTLFLMLTFISTAFRLTAARYTAMYSVEENWPKLANLRRFLRVVAYVSGSVLLVILTAGAPALQAFFHTRSAWPFVLLGLGTPFFLVQGVDRGVLQGRVKFFSLALSYQVEMWSRFGLAVILVALSWSVNGAVAALTLSLVITWWVTRGSGRGLPRPSSLARVEQLDTLRFALPVLVSEASQILINNSDILIVRRFFEPEDAGRYAALALMGRVVFFATWAVMTTVFPMVVRKSHQGQRHIHLFWAALGLVGLVAGSLTFVGWLFPQAIVSLVFGAAYLPIASLLWRYALATSLYALANVVINYRLSLGKVRGSLLAFSAGVAQVAGLWVFHANLAQVLAVQIILMAGLLASVLIWHVGTEIGSRLAASSLRSERRKRTIR